MKLSEAIRLGAMLKPQGQGEFITGDGKTCALGGALDSIGALTDRWHDANCDFLREQWPILALQVTCREAGFVSARPVLDIVISLNDIHDLSRERIADWVASVEAAQAHAQPASANAVDPVGVRVTA